MLEPSHHVEAGYALPRLEERRRISEPETLNKERALVWNSLGPHREDARALFAPFLPCDDTQLRKAGGWDR